MKEATRFKTSRLGRSGIISIRMLAAVTLLPLAPDARAADDYFKTASGDWNAPANWTTLDVPGINTNAYIGYNNYGGVSPAEVRIYSSDDCIASNLLIGTRNTASSGTLYMDGGRLNIGRLTLSDWGGTGIIVQTGGVIVEDSFGAAGNVSGFASWTIAGPGTIVSNITSAACNYPYRGGGSRSDLVISNFASMAGGAITLAYQAGGTSTLTIASGGSFTEASGTLTVGNGGDGTLLVSNAVLNTRAYGISAGSAAGGAGHIRFVDASVVITNMQFSYSGRANLDVAGASAVTNFGYFRFGYSAGSLGTFSMTNGYWFQGGDMNLGNNNVAATGRVEIANATWVQRGTLNVGSTGTGFLTLSNVTCDAATTAINAGGNSGSGTIFLVDSSVVCSNVGVANGSGGKATLTVSGTTVVTNYGTLNFGYGGNGTSVGNMIMTGGRWWQAGTVAVPQCYPGTGILTIAGGEFLPQTNVSIASPTSWGCGLLVITNSAVVIPGTLTIANAGSGTVAVVDGMLDVYGTCILGINHGVGQMSILNMTDSVVTNRGLVSVSATGSRPSARSAIGQSGGRWAVVNNSSVALGTVGTASYVLSNGVFQQTGGTFTIGSATSTGRVELLGAQRSFQVTNLAIKTYGSLTNRLAGTAGGVDITVTNATSLSISTKGVLALVYEQNPAVTGMYWGLRWEGTDHVAALQAMYDFVPKKLDWDDSALDPFYQGQVGIYTDDDYTYVGIPVPVVHVTSKGAIVILR